MAAPRATAGLLGLVLALALSAGLSPAAASRVELHEPHGIAGDVLAGDHVLELLREAAQEVQARPEPPGRPAFTLWPAPPPENGHLFARAPEPPRLELALPAPSIASEIAETLPETRIRAFGLFDPILHPGSNRVSRENATGYALGLWRNRVGPTQKGLWTDPVTGLAYARARWLDTRNGVFLTEDPMGDVDSPNLYAFVAWQPSLGRDPLGTYIVGGKEEAELIRSVFEKAGAPEIAQQIRLDARPIPEEFRPNSFFRKVLGKPAPMRWETRITNDYAEWDSSLDGEPIEQLAWLFDMLMDEETRFEFSVTTSDKGHGGYAVPEEEPHFHYELGVNPALIPDARVVVMGPDGQVDFQGTIPDVEAAVVHEFGHGFGRTAGGVGLFTQEIEYSLHFENVYRQLTTPEEQWPTIRIYEYRNQNLSDYSRTENAVKDMMVNRFFKPSANAEDGN